MASATVAEALLRAAGGGCRAPVGALGTVMGTQLLLIAGHAATDGTGLRIGRRSGATDEATAIALALYGDLWTAAKMPGAAG